MSAFIINPFNRRTHRPRRNKVVKVFFRVVCVFRGLPCLGLGNPLELCFRIMPEVDK